jgi:hypothetical protein
MIERINNQLNKWAEWERTGKTNIGYPKKSAFVGAMGGHGYEPRSCIASAGIKNSC